MKCHLAGILNLLENGVLPSLVNEGFEITDSNTAASSDVTTEGVNVKQMGLVLFLYGGTLLVSLFCLFGELAHKKLSPGMAGKMYAGKI